MFFTKISLTAVLLLANGSIGLAQAQSCNNETVRGYYGNWSEPTVFMQQPGQASPVTVISSGICAVTIDYQGRVSGSCVSSINGQTMEGEIKGSVVVNTDCTATLKFTSTKFPGVEAMAKWIILQGGDLIKEQVVIGLLGKPVGVGTYQRISKVPPA